MPIAKANMGNGFSGAVGYVMVQKDVPQELQPKVIECNNVLQSSSDNIARQMRNVAEENGTKKPVMHMQISFHPDEKLTADQTQKAINSIIKDAGIDRNNHQFLVVEHFDKNHQHFHVVCNRVGLDNKLLSDSHIKIKLNVACDKVEKEQGLRPTEGRQYQFDINTGEGKFVKVVKTKEQSKKIPNDKREKVKLAKEHIQDIVIDVLQTAKTPQEFKDKLADKGVEVRFSEDRANNNEIRGASFRMDEIAVKGGEIGFKWTEIKAILDANLNQEQNKKTDMPGQMQSIVLDVKKEEENKPNDEPLVPTKEEKSQIDFITQYHNALHQSLDTFERYVKLEKIRDIKIVLDHFGFKDTEKGYVFEKKGSSVTLPKAVFENLQNNVIQQYFSHSNMVEKYNELMAKTPAAIPVFAFSSTKNQLRNDNEELLHKQGNAVKPVFNPTFPFPISKFKIKSEFEKRQDSHQEAKMKSARDARKNNNVVLDFKKPAPKLKDDEPTRRRFPKL